MRSVDLGRTAAQAEVVRLKRMVRRQAMRAVWAGVAALFLVAMLAMIHVIAFMALVPRLLPPLLGAVAILVADLVLALLFGLFAMRDAPDTVEAEAKLLRDQALVGLRESLAIATLLNPISRVIFRSAGRKSLWGMTLAALLANFMSKKGR